MLPTPGRILVVALALLVTALLWGFWRAAPVPRADFVFVNGTDPASLDPAKVTGIPEGRILRALLEGLTVGDPATLEPRPGSAERWEVAADGLRYCFWIREEAQWSNGDPVTAHDFVWSWQRLLDPSTGGKYANLLWSVEGAKAFNSGAGSWEDVAIRALDAQRLEVVLTRPTPHFLQLTYFYPLFPLHRATVTAAEAAGERFTSPERWVGNGPFLLLERRLRDRIRMAKNPNYWAASSVAMDTMDALAVESDNTAVNLFLSGGADWIARVPRSLVPILMEDPEFASVYQPSPYFGSYFIRLNVTRAPFDDAAVRRALSLAIDRQEIVERVTLAGEVPAWSFVPWPRPALEEYARRFRARTGTEFAIHVPAPWYQRALLGADSDKAWGFLGHDPDAARALLRSRGYRVPILETQADGRVVEIGFTAGREFPPFEYLYSASSLNERVAELLQVQLRRELGVSLRLTNQEWGSYLSAQRALQYDTSRSAWIGDYVDPYTFLEVFRSDDPNNRTGWKDATYDSLLEQALATSEISERARLLQEAEALLLSELPLIPLYYYVTDGLRDPGLEGISANPLDLHFPRAFRWGEKRRGQ